MTDQLQTIEKPANLPAYIKHGDTRGSENIGTSEVKFPALKLAQATSPEVKRDKPEFIDGLREGTFFNPVTREIIGEDPIYFLVVNYLGHVNKIFDPANRKIVLEDNVKDNDPRCEFTEKDGKRVPPEAVRFMNFLVLVKVPGQPAELMTLSFKKTQLKHGVTLTTIIDKDRRRGLPSFARQFKAQPASDSRTKGDFYGWKIDPAGWAAEADYALASESYDKFADSEVALPLDGEGDGEDTIADDKVPF